MRVAVPLWLSDDCGWKRALRSLEIQPSYHNKTELGDRSVKGAIAERVFLKLLYRTSVNVAVCRTSVKLCCCRASVNVAVAERM